MKKAVKEDIIALCKTCGIFVQKRITKKFIKDFANKIDWFYISRHQKLSEDFIREFADKVDWLYISIKQKLSERFIREFSDRVRRLSISVYQKLSEGLIRDFTNKVSWVSISKYQKLSENFIREFIDRIYWDEISKYQKLSAKFKTEFKTEFKIIKSKNSVSYVSWLYLDTKTKLNYIKKHTGYKIIDDKHIIAYKSCRGSGYSCYNFHYLYKVGKTYKSHCDCNIKEIDSFGLSAWTKEKALKYYNIGKLLKVRIPINKIGAIVQDNNKIRCFEMEILEEVGI